MIGWASSASPMRPAVVDSFPPTLPDTPTEIGRIALKSHGRDYLKYLGQVDVDRLTRVAWAIAVGVLLIVAIGSINVMPGRDASAFIYVADGILDGDVPYLDRWDHKGPLIYALNLLGLAIGGLWGIWIVGVAFSIGSVWLAFVVTRDSFGPNAALFSVAVMLVLFTKFIQGGNLTEHYALLFQLLALLLFTRDQRQRGSSMWLPLSIGVLGAAAFLLRPNIVGVWLSIGVVWTLQLKTRDNTLRSILWAALGGASVLVLASAAFAWVGGLGALWDAVIKYNLAYVDVSFLDRARVLRDMRAELYVVSLPIAAGWAAGLWYRLSGRTLGAGADGLLSLALILAPIEAALISLSGRQWPHYYLTMLPVVTVLLAFLVRLLVDQRLAAPTFLSAALLVAVAYYHPPHRNIAQLISTYGNSGETVQGRHVSVAERIRQVTAPEDSILVWGAESKLYLLSERDAPTRFFYQYPLVKTGYANSTIREEFLSSISRGKPAIIVDTYNGRLPPLDSAKRRQWEADPRGSGRKYSREADVFQPMFDLVEREYHVLEDIEGYTLYRRRE